MNPASSLNPIHRIGKQSRETLLKSDHGVETEEPVIPDRLERDGAYVGDA